MNIGIAKIRIRLFGVSSLKDKRSISKRLINSLRKSYNVSVSEIEAQDSKDLLVIGVSIVSNDMNVIHRTIELIENHIEFTEGLEIERMEKELW